MVMPSRSNVSIASMARDCIACPRAWRCEPRRSASDIPSSRSCCGVAAWSSNDQNVQDMHELFRRMVFNILIDNTDDHEKNHALIATDAQQYRLSPAYDVLPSGQALGFQQMRVGEDEADSTLANALSMAPMFALKTDAAIQQVREVAAVDRRLATALSRMRRHAWRHRNVRGADRPAIFIGSAARVHGLDILSSSRAITRVSSSICCCCLLSNSRSCLRRTASSFACSAMISISALRLTS